MISFSLLFSFFLTVSVSTCRVRRQRRHWWVSTWHLWIRQLSQTEKTKCDKVRMWRVTSDLVSRFQCRGVGQAELKPVPRESWSALLCLSLVARECWWVEQSTNGSGRLLTGVTEHLQWRPLAHPQPLLVPHRATQYHTIAHFVLATNPPRFATPPFRICY